MVVLEPTLTVTFSIVPFGYRNPYNTLNSLFFSNFAGRTNAHNALPSLPDTRPDIRRPTQPRYQS